LQHGPVLAPPKEVQHLQQNRMEITPHMRFTAAVLHGS